MKILILLAAVVLVGVGGGTGADSGAGSGTGAGNGIRTGIGSGTGRLPSAKKKMLVLLAHPDDESAVAAVLAKYASTFNIQLVIATDGRLGVTDHAKIPSGDSLAAVRKLETQCGCSVLGIEPPIFLGYPDGMSFTKNLPTYFTLTASLKDSITAVLQRIKPDLVITFGPDGDTGHPDHRGISNLVTEVILREGWYQRYPLYYIAWSKEKVVNIPQGNMTSLNYVDQKYLDVAIRYSFADREKSFKSLSCYKSQLSPQDVKEWIDAEKLDTSFLFYFRRFRTGSGRADHF